MAKSSNKKKAANTASSTPGTVDHGKWQGVFDAHPDAGEIHVGTNAAGQEQVFLRWGHASNFAGAGGSVETLNRFPGVASTADATVEDGETAGETDGDADETGGKEGE